MNSFIGMAFIAAGIVFDVFGCIGLIRLPDLYNRLQASAKCITFGTCLALIGMSISTGPTAAGIKAVLCAVFILLASPTAAHVLATAARKSGIKLPDGDEADGYEKT